MEGMDTCGEVALTVYHRQLDNHIKNNYPSTKKAILDSGSIGHFLTNRSPQTNIQRNHTPLKIRQPDGNTLVSKNKCKLKIYPKLTKKAREAYSFKNITFPLISVAKLCDDDCMVIFGKKVVYIIKKGKVISEAPRDSVTKLWTTQLDHKDLNDCKEKHDKELIMNVTIPEEAESNIEKLILFLYAALGHPNKTTLIKAIQKGHFAT